MDKDGKPVKDSNGNNIYPDEVDGGHVGKVAEFLKTKGVTKIGKPDDKSLEYVSYEGVSNRILAVKFLRIWPKSFDFISDEK